MTREPAGVAVGVRQPLIDGIEKVTGRARYTADLPAPGALVGAILRSPAAHARIRGIDVSAARAMPGVAAVVTGEDCDIAYGVIPIAQNEFPLARERVRYRGEPVAAVAAVDAATARAALDAIVLDLEPLPAYFDAAASRARRRGAAARQQAGQRRARGGAGVRRPGRRVRVRPTSCASSASTTRK